MKFGKVAEPDKVDFSFPYPPAEVLKKDQAKGKSLIYIGATGWSMKEWLGKWYPPKTKSTQYLTEYGKLFNTIELNTTHYRIPTVEQVVKWREQVPADFRFCPKLPQRISHVNTLGIGSGLIEQTVEAFAAFEEKLGCCFIQLPPYFGFDRLAILERFLQAWPQTMPLAVEMRHESWFSGTDRIDSWTALLKKHGVTAVITDVAGRRDVLHLRITAPRTMIRWVGNGLLSSDYERMKDWVDVLKAWKLPETFIFPHEPDNVLAPDAAAWFSEHLLAFDWVDTRGPSLYQEPPPDQLALF